MVMIGNNGQARVLNMSSDRQRNDHAKKLLYSMMDFSQARKTKIYIRTRFNYSITNFHPRVTSLTSKPITRMTTLVVQCDPKILR